MRTFRFGVAFVAAVIVVCGIAGCGSKQEQQNFQGETGTISLDTATQIRSFQEILAKEPKNLQALVALGNLYFDTGQDLLAIDNYERALVIEPGNNNVRTDMAVCYRRAKRPDRAIEELKRVIASDPRHSQSRFNLGIILVQDKGDLAGGAKAWEDLLAAIPEYPDRENLKANIAQVRQMAGSMPAQGGGAGSQAGGGVSAPSGLTFGGRK